MINEALLLDTLEYIESHPEEWNQADWITPCGTAMCFAGRAAILAGAQVPARAEGVTENRDLDLEWNLDMDGKLSDQGVHVATWAVRVLGISRDDASELFCAGNSIEELREVVHNLIEYGKALR